MNIGIDIDDTINNLHDILLKEATEFNQKENIQHKIQTDKWNWDEAWGWDEIIAEKFLNNNCEKMYLQATIKPNATEVINKLKEEGNNIIIITSRSEKHCRNPYKTSKTWLDKHNVKYDKLITDCISKVEECIENNIDVLIDDHVGFCTNVGNKTKTKVLMFDSPYNKKCNFCTRVYNWEQVYEEIKNIK